MRTNGLLSAESIMSDSVKNSEGKDLGSIKELMLNPENGHIDYAVLSFGGFMGMGDKYFAVPWDAIEVDRERKTLRLDMPKERLEKMEGFDKSNWPDFANEEFENKMHQHFDGIGRYSSKGPRAHSSMR